MIVEVTQKFFGPMVDVNGSDGRMVTRGDQKKAPLNFCGMGKRSTGMITVVTRGDKKKAPLICLRSGEDIDWNA